MNDTACTQAVALLTDCPLELESVFGQLTTAGFVCELIEGNAPDGSARLQIRGAFRGDGDAIVVDTFPNRWPEALEVPSTWGPCTTSDSLARAVRHSAGWEEAREFVDQHQGFLLLRFFEGASTPQTRDERITSFLALVKLVRALSELPEVTAFFCPGGEVLLPLEFLGDVLQTTQMVGMPPFDLLANLRLSWLDERWIIFETVGNRQIDLADLEVYADSQGKDLNEIASWLRRWSWQHSLPEKGLVDGSIVDGPNGTKFQVIFADDALLAPKRNVVRLVCQDSTPMPEGLPQRLQIDHA